MTQPRHWLGRDATPVGAGAASAGFDQIKDSRAPRRLMKRRAFEMAPEGERLTWRKGLPL
jgi:hypothetical protein